MKKSLAQNAAYNVVYRLLNVIFPLISATYISRVLAPEGVGKVAYAQNIMSYFLMFAVLCIPQYGTREIAKRQNRQQEKNVLFSELAAVNFISTAICTAAYYVFVWVAFPVDAWVYFIFGLELLFNFINIDWLYQGEEEYIYITRRSILVKLLSLLALFLFVKKQDDYVLYALILCMGIGCNNIFNVFHARKRVSFTLRGLNLQQHLEPILVLMTSTVVASLYNKVDITMLGWISTDAAVGYYTNAHKVISIVLGLVTAMSAVFFPRLSYAYQNDQKQFRECITSGLKIVLVLAIPGCLGLVLVADALTTVLFGAEFAPAAATIRILAVFTIIKGVGDLLCYQAVVSSGNEKKLIKSRIFAGIANVILNAVLIPKFAHNGAAAASVISELIVNGMLLRYALTIVKPELSKGFCGSLISSSLTMGVAVVLVQHFMDGGVLKLIMAVAAGIAVFAMMMIVTKNEIVEAVLQKMKARRS